MEDHQRTESMHHHPQAPPPQAQPMHVANPVQQLLALAMPGSENWTDKHDEWLWESRGSIGARMRHLAALRGQPVMTEFTEHGLQLVHQVPKPVRKPRGDGDKPHKRRKSGDVKKADGSTEKVQKYEWRQALKMPLGWMQKVYECVSQPSGIRTACYMAPDGTRYNNKVAAIAAMAIEQNPSNVAPLTAHLALEAPQAQAVQSVQAIHDQQVHAQAVHDQQVHAQAVHDQHVHAQALHDHVLQAQAIHDQQVQAQAIHDQAVHAQALHDQQVHAQAVQAVHDQAAHAQAMHEQAVQAQAAQAQAAHEQALHAQAVQAAQAQAAHDQAVAAVQAQAIAALHAPPVSVPMSVSAMPDGMSGHVPVPTIVPAMVD